MVSDNGDCPMISDDHRRTMVEGYGAASIIAAITNHGSSCPATKARQAKSVTATHVNVWMAAFMGVSSC